MTLDWSLLFIDRYKMTNSAKTDAIRVLAVSSGGGHWVELLRLLPAFEGMDLCFATVINSYRSEICHIPKSRFYCIKDVTRWNKIGWLQTVLQILWIIIKEHPDFIVSTGALPGYFALRIGKIFGAKTIWIDSIANADQLSSSGKHIGKYSDLWLTQWKHLSKNDGPDYHGAVL